MKKKPNLLVLLGTGATMPEIPGVKLLTDSLIAADYTQTFKTIQERRIKNGEKFFNFEDLLGIVEPPYSQHNPLTKGLSNLSQDYIKGSYHMLSEVSLACDKIEKNNDILPVTKGLEKLSDHFRLNIFSLNYDDCPEHTNKMFYYSGYDNTGNRSGNAKGDYKFNAAKAYQTIEADTWPSHWHFHFQLHGSILFGPDERSWGVLPRFPTREYARLSWNNRLSYNSSFGGISRPHLPIVSGYRKTDSVLWEPLGTYWAVFRQAAARCPFWLVIGYGGADPHVNACLQSSMNQSVTVGHIDGFHHAVVIDYTHFEPYLDIKYDLNLDESCDEIKIKNVSTFLTNRRKLGTLENDPINEILINKIISPWAYADIVSDDSYPFIRKGFINSNRINQISKRLSVTLDGTSWALTNGFQQILSTYEEARLYANKHGCRIPEFL